MPEKNNGFDLPELKHNEEEKKQIIEIPQEYYDKLEKERQEKEEKQKVEQELEAKKIAERKSNNKSMLLIIFNAIIILVLLYCMLNINNLFLIAIPIYIILMSIIKGISEKNESDFPLAILVGGMLSGVVSFIISIIKSDMVDTYTHYAIASVLTAFIGFIISGIVTRVVYDFKNIKALQTIMIIAFFVALFGGPYYLYTKYPEEFNKTVFLKRTEVVAETESEFILKTLKNRYNLEFTCEDKAKNYIDTQKQRVTTRTCYDPDKIEFLVTSTTYDETNVLYTIKENYFEVLYLSEAKENLIAEIKNLTGATNVSISLFPKEKCNLIGDCVDSEEYYQNYEKENDRQNLYNYSKDLNLTNYLNLSKEEFINSYEFKFYIQIYNNFGGITSSNYENIINNTLNVLNSSGYKNTSGFEITLKNSAEVNKEVYKVEGSKSDDKTFKNPQIVES